MTSSPSSSNQPLHILVSNDDGIDAPGLAALVEALHSVGRVTVVAPARERSAVGHAISVYNDLMLHKKYSEDGTLFGYALDGTPADCVKWAVTTLLRDDPADLVVSGINWGQNIGNNIIYSGTVAAAREGAMFGIPSMAVSLSALRSETPHFMTAAAFAAQLAPLLKEVHLPPGVLLNVNVPNLPRHQVQGIVVSRMGKAMFLDEFEIAGDKAEFVAVRNVGKRFLPTEGGAEDHDDQVLQANKISITPLQYDLTHHDYRRELERWLMNRLDGFNAEPLSRAAGELSRRLSEKAF
ncbi:MAG: 5'/3'-nucleotidase SurE [Candidatus Sumerlaeia bacterium]